jgi:urease accessory protein
MIQLRNLTRLNGNMSQRTCCRYFRRTTGLACCKRNPRRNHRDRGDSNRGQAMLGTSGPGIAISTTTIMSWKRAERFFQNKPMNLCKSMFDVAAEPDLTGYSNLFDSPKVLAANLSDKDLQRADGSGRIVLSGSEKGTRIMDVFQRSPIRIMFPRTGGGAVEEAVLINTAGGIAGGDRLECSVTALVDASIAVTSQAAEKVYRALNEPARIATKLKVCEAAKLAWLPQETIVFNWARLSRETEIDLSSGAELLALEWLVLGRAAHGENMVGGHITDSWRVKKDGRLIWTDTFRATDETFPHLHRRALLSNRRAIATLIYFGPDLDTRLESVREIASSLECDCAATSVGGLIIVRFAANVSSNLGLALRSFLQQFGRELGPGPFRVPKMWSC